MANTLMWASSTHQDPVTIVTDGVKLPLLIEKGMRSYAMRFYRLHLSTLGTSLRIAVRKEDDRYLCEATLAASSTAPRTRGLDWDIRRSLTLALNGLRSPLAYRSRGTGVAFLEDEFVPWG